MSTSEKNEAGLAESAIRPVIEQLSRLLADYQVFYTNLRGFHWNIRGDKFYELHELYEEYYNEIAETIDALAERIVILGGQPANAFSDYLKTAKVKEVSGVSDWKTGASNVLDTLKLLLDEVRTLIQLALKAGDGGTLHLANHSVTSFEKKIWMLSAYLED